MFESDLKGFIETVNSEIDKQINDILEDAEKQRKDILSKAEKEALDDAYQKIQSAVSKNQSREKMTISKAEQEARINLLTYREKLVQSIFDEVERKVIEFTKSNRYKDYLISLLCEENIQDETVIYLKPEDMQYVNQLMETQRKDCVFTEEKSIKYGGLSVQNKNSPILINKTIDNMLEEERRNFSSNYKLA